MIRFHPYLFNLIDNTNRRTGFPNEKHELSAGCTENRRVGQQAVPKGGLADCGKGRGRLRKGQPSGMPFSTAQLNVQPTGLSCSAACRPVLLCSSWKIHVFHLATRPSSTLALCLVLSQPH